MPNRIVRYANRIPLVTLAFCVTAGALASQQDSGPTGLPPEYAAGPTTEHFSIFAREGSDAELRALGARAEAYFGRISDVVGPVRTPSSRLTIILAGDGRTDPAFTPGFAAVPHVDRQGRVILYRFRDDFEDYYDPLAHELVHAFRRASGHRLSGFVEEGFAFAQDVAIGGPDRYKAPNYGFPLELVAAHFLFDDGFELGLIRDRHRELNLRCAAQTYSVRGSFFNFLRREYGHEALVALAYPARVSRDDPFSTAFGQPFSQLEAAWRAALATNWRNTPNREAAIRRFLEETPVRELGVCEPRRELEPRALGGRPDPRAATAGQG